MLCACGPLFLQSRSVVVSLPEPTVGTPVSPQCQACRPFDMNRQGRAPTVSCRCPSCRSNLNRQWDSGNSVPRQCQLLPSVLIGPAGVGAMCIQVSVPWMRWLEVGIGNMRVFCLSLIIYHFLSLFSRSLNQQWALCTPTVSGFRLFDLNRQGCTPTESGFSFFCYTCFVVA